MSKLWFKVFLIVLPVALVMGFVRLAANSFEYDGQFLPTWNDMLRIFSQMPDIKDMWQDAINGFNDAQSSMAGAFVKINDLPSFFYAIGQFFAFLGAVFKFAFDVVAIPFKLIYWFLYFFLNWSPAVTTPLTTP